MRPERDLGEELIARGIKLRQLALLVAVGEGGQLGRGAAVLNMTQPAASRMLADLERIVGARLTQRHSRGVSLTPAGARLAERARAMLRDLGLAGREVRDLDRGRLGTVNLGSVSGPSLELVLPIVRGLERTGPGLRVRVNVQPSQRLAADLLAGHLDLYLGRVPEGVDPRAFEQTPVGPEPLALVVRGDHPLAEGRCDLADCLAHEWVMEPPGSVMHGAVEAYLADRGLEMPAMPVSTTSLMMTLGFVLNSQAVGVMSAPAARLFAAVGGGQGGIRVLDLAPDLAVAPFAIVTLRARRPGPALEAFLAILRQELQRRAAAAG